MESTTRTKMRLLIAALIVTALAIAAAAQTQVPFKGTFQGSESFRPPATIITTATGTGTHLGQLSYNQEATINLGSFTNAGSAQWTAANGDSIHTTFVGSAIPGPVVFEITEVHTITGGTGRFTGAEGSFIVHRTHLVQRSEDGTNAVFGSFEGTITSPGLAR